VDPAACRESLATLLSQETSALDELAALLDHEHALLVANDVDALETAMQTRQITVGRILRIEDERRALCHAHGHNADAAGLEQLLAWCDPTGSLKARWAQCGNVTSRCRDLNVRNAALVTARMRRVATLLNTLTGQPVEAATYGPKGAYTVPRSGRVLATEA
jgi:flagellar biosynthesis protein FlgN